MGLVMQWKDRQRDLRLSQHNADLRSQDISVQTLVETVARELKFALSSLRRAPGFAIISVLILALGIGMSTAMFTVLHAVVLQQLPVREPDRIVTLWTFRDPTVRLTLLSREMDAVRSQSRLLRDMAGVVNTGAQTNPVTEGDRPLLLKQALVTANFFDLLGARPALGRLLRPEDGVTGAAPVAVISYATWQRQLAGDSSALGRRLTTVRDQHGQIIVGVAPPGLDYPAGTDYWIPAPPYLLFNAVARLAPGATAAAAQAEFLSLAQRADELGLRRTPAHPTGAAIQTLTDAVLGDTKPALVVLSVAVGLLLLIACVNVGSLLLLRASTRAREIAIRRALGASSAQIARLMLAECAPIALAGGMLGFVVALALVRALLAFAPTRLPRVDLIAIAGAPLAAAGVATGVTLLLFGMLPALIVARTGNLVTVRGDGRGGGESRRHHRARHLMIASQAALAVVMLAGAGLLVRSLQRLEQVALGYDTAHVAVVELSVPFSKYATSSAADRALSDIFTGVRAIPGVTGVTPVLYRPFVGGNLMQVTPFAEAAPVGNGPNNAVSLEVAGPEYFRTFGVPIQRGRGFNDGDVQEDAPSTVVVSEVVARRLWGNQDPLGKRVRFGGQDTTAWRTVIGVAGEVRLRRLRETSPLIYVPWRSLISYGTFAVRTRGDFASVLPAMRRVIVGVDPQISIWTAKTMDEHLDGPLAQPRLNAILLSSFGVVALLLLAIGLYGIMATTVRERTHDLGVRLALGATPERLRREVLASALVITASGGAAGLILAVVGSRYLGSLLFGVSPIDPASLIAACALLLGIGLVAAYVPARRATRADPMQALRAE